MNWSAWENQPQIGERSSAWSSGRDVEERRRPRAGVQVLVGAADGQVDADRVEVDLDGTGRVAEIPQDERPRGLAAAVIVGHVGERARAVVHARQHDQRRPVGARAADPGRLRPGDGSVVEHPQLAPRPCGQPRST